MTSEMTSTYADSTVFQGEGIEAAGLPPVRPVKRRRFDVILSIAVGWLALMTIAALFASLLPIAAPNESIGPRLQPAFQELGNSMALGTDAFGRSLLSRAIYGARSSLLVGVSAATIGCLVGGMIGLLAGYMRGRTDRATSFLIDTLLAFPPLVVLLTLTAILRPQMSTIILGLSLLSMPTFARLERGSALVLAERPFVLAARSYGTSRVRTAFAHVLPNSVVTLVTFLPTIIAALIVAEGSLSFLGLGIPPPTVTWGGMILEGKSYLRNSPNQVFVPGAFIFLTVFSFNILGERARGWLDSRRRV